MNGDLFSLIKGLNLNKILSGANKTLGFVKQAIPVYRQIQPMMGNFKNLKNIVNIYSSVKQEDKKEPEIDEIKESRPLKTVIKNNTRNNESDINDTLTFFQ